MSPKDRIVANALAKSEDRTAESVKAVLNMKQNEFSPYRKRLLDKGIISSTGHGLMDFTLPFFDEYKIEREDF